MFRRIAKALIVKVLTWQAGLVLRKYRPKIIGVTGSVGKTATKDAIYSVLACHLTVRRSQKSYNSELGIPLTILGLDNSWSNPLLWIRNIVSGFGLLIFKTDYPEWLVLEVGVDREGDIARVVSWINFDVVVLTALPSVPVHVEFFSSIERLFEEKRLLARAVGQSGVVILNADDTEVMKTVPEIKAKVITYGFNEGAKVRANNFHLLYRGEGKERRPEGITLKVEYGGNSAPFSFPGVLGYHQLYAVLAAMSVGLSQGQNLVSLAPALEAWTPPPGRMRLLAGIKQTLIIDDTYNSSPAALEAALATLGTIEVTGRKIAVIGDMLELGAHTIDAHRRAGVQAHQVADILITVGLRAKFVAEGAARKRMSPKKMFHFDDAVSAGRELQALIKPGDLILIKGSQSIRLERAVEEIMAEPDKKASLLVRQEPDWVKRA